MRAGWADGMTPIPIQRSRKLGATHPPGTLFVDRTSKVFGNPYKVIKVNAQCYKVQGFSQKHIRTSPEAAAKVAVDEYRDYLIRMKKSRTIKFLRMMEVVDAAPYIACYCALDAPCHRNVLIELASEPRTVAELKEA